jgi:hypothetical protein
MKEQKRPSRLKLLGTIAIVLVAAVPIAGGFYLWFTQEERDSKHPL